MSALFRAWRRYTNRYGRIAGSLLLLLAAVGVASQAQTLHGLACSNLPVLERNSPFACPAARETRPQVVDYQKQREDFRLATVDGDEPFLQKLHHTGFKLRPADVCEMAVLLSGRAGPETLGEAATGIFVRSIPKGHECETGSWMLRRNSASVPVVLLDRGLFPHDVSGPKNAEVGANSCGVDQAARYWPRQTALIERVLGEHGMPDDFRAAVRGYLEFATRLRGLSSQSYEKACVQAVLGDGQSLPMEFLFSRTACRGLEFVQRRWRLDIAHQGAHTDRGTLDHEAAERVCRGTAGLDLSTFGIALRRWDKTELTKGGG